MWISLYYIVLFLILTAFAIYDVKKRRVPNLALVYFLPVALLSVPINALWLGESLFYGSALALFGLLMGGGTLLAAAVATNGGIGGGDVKLSALLGLIYGPYGITAVLAAASALALIFGTAKKLCRKDEKARRMAFVPFLLAGAVLTTLFKISF